MSFELQIAQAKKQPNTKVTKKFSKPIPMDNNPFKEGDRFTIEPDYQVIQRKFGNGIDEFTFVEVTETSGDVVVKPFRPSMLTKRVHVVDPDTLELGDWVRADGSVVREFVQHKDVDEGIRAIAGREIEITNQDDLFRFVYGSNEETEQTPVFTVDFVGAEEAEVLSETSGDGSQEAETDAEEVQAEEVNPTDEE